MNFMKIRISPIITAVAIFAVSAFGASAQQTVSTEIGDSNYQVTISGPLESKSTTVTFAWTKKSERSSASHIAVVNTGKYVTMGSLLGALQKSMAGAAKAKEGTVFHTHGSAEVGNRLTAASAGKGTLRFSYVGLNTQAQEVVFSAQAAKAFAGLLDDLTR